MVYRDDRLVVAQAEWEGPIEVPDIGPEGSAARALLPIDEVGVVRRIQLEVDLRHASVSDLNITLVSPSGQRALVYTQFPADGSTHALRFDSDNFVRLEPLLGEASAGVWLVLVRDALPKDRGALARAAITIEIVGPARG